jgi:hypothetical protein
MTMTLCLQNLGVLKSGQTVTREEIVRLYDKHILAIPVTPLEGTVFEALKVAPIVIPLPPTVSVIDAALAQSIVDRTRPKLDELIERYAPGKVDKWGHPVVIPERIQDHLRKVFRAPTVGEADRIAARTVEIMLFHMMKLWSEKKVVGPPTPRNIESQAKSAESWAEKLDRDGKFERAEQQRVKAATIRGRLNEKP